MAKNNRNQRQAPSQQPAANAAPAAPRIMLVNYAVFSFKNGTAIKAPIDTADAGKAILRDVLVSLTSGKPYINEEKGILFNPSELSHNFLVVEQVQQ